MQHLLVTLKDSASLRSLKSTLSKMSGIERVEALTPKRGIDSKKKLHKPIRPLSKAQLETLANKMNKETTFFTLEEAREKGYKMIDEWHKQSLS